MESVPVSELVNGVSRSLTSVAEAIKEFGLLRGFKDDMLTLKHHFDKIQAVLQDAEDKRIRGSEIDTWLKSLKSVTLKVEDVVDEISTEALLQRLYKERGISNRVRAFSFSYPNLLKFRVRIAQRVKSMRRELDAIASKISELKLTSSGATSHVDVGIENEIPDRLLTPDSFDNDIVGREKELERVIRTICNKDIGKSEDSEVRVYAIVGMGGSGKTTLAQLVYDHERVNQHFEFKFWINISDNFNVIEIITRIITLIDKHKCTVTRLDLLQESLRKKLMGKKFLIILDDIWTPSISESDALRATLSYGAEGSIVLITTREITTSQMMAKFPESQLYLDMFSEVDSLLLFRKLAFAQGRVGDDISELEPIVRELVKRCCGLPLALNILGSLMWSKSSISDWQLVKDSEIWMLKGYDIMPELMVSYDNLPPHVKRCFAYCCLFPRGFVMEKDVVIQLWIVNSFIPPRGEIDLYELGDEIFNFLVWRSFFQVVKDNRYLNAPGYRMHDIVYDLACIGGDEYCVIITGWERNIHQNGALHLSLQSPHIDIKSQDLGKLKSLRSMFLFGVECKCNINNMYLRVLYLSGSGLNTLPESICKLKHLRYLNLSYTSIIVLPDSIIYLQNLQVLLLNFCYYLRKLPEDMRYMSSLRLLELNSCHSLLHLPLGIEKITKLPRLTRFDVGKKTPKIEELGDLNHFEGELEITGLENVERFQEARSAHLERKTNLSVLKLCWSNIHMRESKRKMFADDEEVLKGLKPNSSLQKLSIYFFMGNNISPDWMGYLVNLVEIGFSGCKRCESIPPLGELPNLKVIKLLGMDSLVCFHEKDTSEGSNMFRCLEELYISMCPNLISLPTTFSTLKILKLEECGALMSLPVQCFRGLKELKINGCVHLSRRYGAYEDKDWSKISHIPDIKVDSLSCLKMELRLKNYGS